MGKNIDYAFKSYVLREHEDLLIKYNQTNSFEYAISEFDTCGVVSPWLKHHCKNNTMRFSALNEYARDNGLLKELCECKKITKAHNSKVHRLRKRVQSILVNGASLFLTLTFNDDTLKSTNEKQRRRYVREFLSRYHCSYVGNVDYGKENHREHYHALIAVDRVDNKLWSYGSINFEKVRLRNRTDTRLSKYIAKLSNHAIKETTKRSALIYSRVNG